MTKIGMITNVKRTCNNCSYYNNRQCTGLWLGRKIVSYNTCVGHSLGDDHLLKDRKFYTVITKEQSDEARKLFKDGATVTELAERYNVPYSTIYDHVNALRYVREMNMREKEEEKELIELMEYC